MTRRAEPNEDLQGMARRGKNAAKATLGLVLTLLALAAAGCGPSADEVAATREAEIATAIAGAPTVAPQPATQTQGGTVSNQYSAPPPMTIDTAKSYTAVLYTNLGQMTIQLFPDEAPLTVNNFVFLAREGFYNDVVFHRIIKGFMAQTGDPMGTGQGGPGYQFKDEPVTRSYIRGTLAMANAGPNTNGSQFFLVHQDAGLPPSYTIFGVITEGLDTLDSIANTPVTGSPSGEVSRPTERVFIERVEIIESDG